ncbi:site-specific integrase, partial [Acidisphaera rubrifaciens]|uniref:site-specific integrase n=1 Tax=Acidisphaera rubrifaciens TaxID=50715 RepID=UPI000662128B
RAGTPTHATALDLQAALAIELLIMAPIRMANLSGLRCGVHLLRGRDGGVTLALAGHEVKNRMPFEVRLPDDTARLLDLYEAHYRPLLNAAGGDWLFPGRRPDAPKSSEGFRQQIQRCLRVRCGLAFHPHLFRHAAAKLILEDNPGAHGQVQRVLGHKTMATTLAYYTGMEAQAAVAHYDMQVVRLRADGALPPPAPDRRRGSR